MIWLTRHSKRLSVRMRDYEFGQKYLAKSQLYSEEDLTTEDIV